MVQIRRLVPKVVMGQILRMEHIAQRVLRWKYEPHGYSFGVVVLVRKYDGTSALYTRSLDHGLIAGLQDTILREVSRIFDCQESHHEVVCTYDDVQYIRHKCNTRKRKEDITEMNRKCAELFDTTSSVVGIWHVITQNDRDFVVSTQGIPMEWLKSIVRDMIVNPKNATKYSISKLESMFEKDPSGADFKEWNEQMKQNFINLLPAIDDDIDIRGGRKDRQLFVRYSNSLRHRLLRDGIACNTMLRLISNYVSVQGKDIMHGPRKDLRIKRKRTRVSNGHLAIGRILPNHNKRMKVRLSEALRCGSHNEWVSALEETRLTLYETVRNGITHVGNIRMLRHGEDIFKVVWNAYDCVTGGLYPF